MSTSRAKCSALDLLHKMFHPLADEYEKLKNESKSLRKSDQSRSREIMRQAERKLTTPKNLCGHTEKDAVIVNGKPRGAIPSPIWIANLENYQVVTVFGATQDPRKAFVKELMDQKAVQVFPIT